MPVLHFPTSNVHVSSSFFPEVIWLECLSFPFFSTSSQNICLIAIFVCIIFLVHLCAFPLLSFYLHCIKSFDLRIISRPSISSTGVMWEEHQPSSSPNPFIVTSIFFLKLVPLCTHLSVNHASLGGRVLPALPTSLLFL